MGANAQTAVPVFTAGQVLTAAQQNQINTGIPVFATTVTRDAAFGGTGEKTLAEGQFAYIEATNATQYYDGAAWQAVDTGGMTLLSTTTLSGATTTITISDFSYNYIFGQIAGMTNATANGAVTMKPNNSATLFHGVQVFNGNGTAGTAASTDTTIDGATTSTRTDANNIWTFMIFNYASSTQYKNYFHTQGAERAAGGTASNGAFGYIKTNSQISSLVLANSGGSWTGGTVTIYGVK